MAEKSKNLAYVKLKISAARVARAQRELDEAREDLERDALALYAEQSENKQLLEKPNGRAAIAIEESKVFEVYDFGPESDALVWMKRNHAGAGGYDWSALEKLAERSPDEYEQAKAAAHLLIARQLFPQFIKWQPAYEKEAKTNPLAPVRPKIVLRVKYAPATLAEFL